MEHWLDDLARGSALAVVTRGSAEENRAKAAEHGVRPVLLQREDEVADAYQAHGTPSAVLVNADGTIASPVRSGAEAIRDLVSHIGESPGASPWAALRPVPMANGHVQAHDHEDDEPVPARLRVGQPAPPLKLPDLDGSTVDLADFRGGETPKPRQKPREREQREQRR